VNFYGGEPLLSFNVIRTTVSFLEDKNKELDKKSHYAVTTNGSLLTGEIIKFLDKHKFSVELSFDGLAQDISRKKGSFKKIVPVIKELLNYSSINLEINSVFTPETLKYLSESIEFLIDTDVPNISLSFSTVKPWDQPSLFRLKDEMIKLRKITFDHYKDTGSIPITDFRKDNSQGIFYCAAGKDRLAVTPEGTIWGCYLFADYFKRKEESPENHRFCFGNIDDFIENHRHIYPSIYSNYKHLSMDNFSTPKMECFLCPEIEKCFVCPVNAAFSGIPLGKIPQHLCEIQKLKIREREMF